MTTLKEVLKRLVGTKEPPPPEPPPEPEPEPPKPTAGPAAAQLGPALGCG